MNDYIAGLNELFRYGDRENLLSLLASDPEHRHPNAHARMIAADWIEENAEDKSDTELAHYLRSPHPLAVTERGKVLAGSSKLHRLMTTLTKRHWSRDHADERLADPLNVEAEKELRRLGRTHEAELLLSNNPIVYKDGLVRGNHPSAAWPGGYPLIYHTADGGVLCPQCRNGGNGSLAMQGDDDQWIVTGEDAHYEGPPMGCDHCGKLIESAYGDPDAEDEDQ